MVYNAIVSYGEGAISFLLFFFLSVSKGLSITVPHFSVTQIRTYGSIRPVSMPGGHLISLDYLQNDWVCYLLPHRIIGLDF